MRSALSGHLHRRIAVRAVVGRFGTRTLIGAIRQRTVLLLQLTDAAGAPLAQHMWLGMGRRLAALAPQPGDLIEFRGTVRPYVKGRLLRPDGTLSAGSTDLKLSYPTALRIVRQRPTPATEEAAR